MSDVPPTTPHTTKKAKTSVAKKSRSKAARKTPARRSRSKKASMPGARRLRLGLIIVTLLMLLVGGTLAGLEYSRVKKDGAHKEQVADNGPMVETAQVKRAPPVQTLTLEGEARPAQEATIYAKVSGYLTAINVIEGSVVKAGDMLGKISSPETDQAYIAAVADARNKDKIAARYRILLKQDLVSAQEAEQAIAAAQVADATLLSKKQLKDYENLRAPFDGIVTARYVDPGDLIGNSSSSKSTQNAVVTLSATTRLKVDAYVDQKYAPYVHAGLPVETFVPERADERFKGEVARVSGALDRKTRMLFTEIDFDNSANRIVSGSFVQVQIKVSSPEAFTVPVEALVTLNGAPAVAKILPNKHLKFTPIQIVDNDGTDLTISSGVAEGETLALNVGSALTDGDAVQSPEADQKMAGAKPGTASGASSSVSESMSAAQGEHLAPAPSQKPAPSPSPSGAKPK